MSNSLHRAFLPPTGAVLPRKLLSKRPRGIISATSNQVKFATNRLLKPLR
jgi:hypothetical protein